MYFLKSLLSYNKRYTFIAIGIVLLGWVFVYVSFASRVPDLASRDGLESLVEKGNALEKSLAEIEARDLTQAYQEFESTVVERVDDDEVLKSKLAHVNERIEWALTTPIEDESTYISVRSQLSDITSVGVSTSLMRLRSLQTDGSYAPVAPVSVSSGYTLARSNVLFVVYYTLKDKTFATLISAQVQDQNELDRFVYLQNISGVGTSYRLEGEGVTTTQSDITQEGRD